MKTWHKFRLIFYDVRRVLMDVNWVWLEVIRLVGVVHLHIVIMDQAYVYTLMER